MVQHTPRHAQDRRQGQRDGPPARRPRRVQDGGGQRVEPLRIGQYQEVVAADVPHARAARRRVLQGPPHRPDQLVTRREPGAVVDLFEVVDIQPAQRERPPVRDPAVHLAGDRVRTGQPGQRIEPRRLLDPRLGERPYEVREPYDAHTPPVPVHDRHIVGRTVPVAHRHDVQHLPGGGVDTDRPRRVPEFERRPVGVQGMAVAPRHGQQEPRTVHRPDRHPARVDEQHSGHVRRPGQQGAHLTGGRGGRQEGGGPYELPYRRPRTRRRATTGAAGRNVYVRRGQPGGRREELALRQLRAGRDRRRVLQLGLDALHAQQRAQFVAQGPHRPHRRRPRQQRGIELHQVGRHVDQQPQGYVAVPDAVRADPEALLGHVRVRRDDVEGHLPGHPAHFPHGVVQLGQPGEVGEGPGEDVDMQGQQRLLAGRGPDRRHGQTAVEFGVPSGFGQDVAGLRTGKNLQPRHPAGGEIDHRLEGEAESIRPGVHGKHNGAPRARPSPVHETFTQDSGMVTERGKPVHAPLSDGLLTAP